MAICQTIFHGQGGNCTTGGALDNYGSTTFDGYWHAVSHVVCGQTWLSPINANGVLHPAADNYAFFPGTLTIEYIGDCSDYNDPDNDGTGSGTGGTGGTGGTSTQRYDCLNGGCVNSRTYKTPGVFATVAACQSGCANNSPCDGECFSAAEVANIKQGISNLQRRLCG
jgi:hypothetical protein